MLLNATVLDLKRRLNRDLFFLSERNIEYNKKKY